MSIKDYIYPPDNDGTQKEMMEDPRWEGVPPVGDRPISKMKFPFLPIYGKWAFLLMILLVFVVKIIIWGIYRYFTGNPDLIPFFADRANVYWVGMVAKPVLQLTPVVLLWIWMFKEKGIPFRFTKKNLFSSVSWGCIGGLIFFVVASFVYVAHMYARGMGSEFSLVVGWDVVGWGLVTATMFSYMIGTGPTEEIFSRGFLQDQSARAISVGGAIVFSSVLFAAGHLPISILVYDLPLDVIMWYMVVLFIMGCFFSIIYHWSRNIVLGIIIHGLWDWYLTLYQIKGAYTTSTIEASMATFGFLDTVNTLITLAIMLPIFYLLYRVFWKKKSRESDTGSTPVRNIRRLDRGHIFKKPWQPWAFTIAVCLIFCLLMIPAGAVLATDDPEKMKDRREEPLLEAFYTNGSLEQSSVVNEGSSEEVPISSFEGDMILIDISFTWTDEPDESGLLFSYTNEPDTFRVSLVSPTGEDLQAGSNDQGIITLSWSVNDENAQNGTFTIIIELVNAGDQEPPFQFQQPIADDSNSYELVVDYESVLYQELDEDDYHIRW